MLLASTSVKDSTPGEFRRTQNWIGGNRPGSAHFVPPPAPAVADAVSDLERFLHDSGNHLPALVGAGVAHVQFETIHPFLDGNGRVGRLLITLLLVHDGVLRDILLYLSLHLKQNREQYYALLDGVRRDGDWEAWLAFFLEGVTSTAVGAVAAAQRLVELFQRDRDRVQREGRVAGSALRVHEALQQRPITSLQESVERTGLYFPAASSGMQVLERLGIARELTGKQRNRL